MFFELSFPRGDAHIWNSIMAASKVSSVCDSCPFATLFFDCQEHPLPSSAMPLLPGPWNLQAFHGTEDNCMKHIKEEAKALGRSQGIHFRNAAISCVAAGHNVSDCVPLPQKAHGSAMHVKPLRCQQNKKQVSKKFGPNKKNAKKQLTFSSSPAHHVPVKKLHDLTLNRIESNVMPTLHMEPAHQRKKVNEELEAKFQQANACKVTNAAQQVVNEIDPALLLGLAAKNSRSHPIDIN